MKKILVAVLVVAIALIGVTAAFAANHTSMTCRVCHTPHGGQATPPLWDAAGAAARAALSGAATPAGGAASMVCINCHDGVGYALAEASRTAVWADAGINDHPVGVVGGGGGGTTLGVSQDAGLYATDNTVQCFSCHYVHNDPAITAPGTTYVRLTPVAGAGNLCLSCHVGW